MAQYSRLDQHEDYDASYRGLAPDERARDAADVERRIREAHQRSERKWAECAASEGGHDFKHSFCLKCDAVESSRKPGTAYLPWTARR